MGQNPNCSQAWGLDRWKTCYYPNNTIKFQKYAPGLIIFKGSFWRAYFWRGLCTEGNLRFKIDYASLWLKGNLPFFLSFTLYLRALFSSTSPGGLYAEGTLNGGFFALRVWGAYTWRGFFSEFYGIMIILKMEKCILKSQEWPTSNYC